MAVNNLSIYSEKDGLGFPLNFRRGNPNPLDNSSVWATYDAAKNYAETDPVAYVGQILSVVDSTNGVVTVYSIQDEAGNLKAVGSSPVGDESTITVAENGTVSLYGVAGLELTRTDDEGNETKISYQPLLVDGKLTWVEPSATTVEGLATELEGIKTRLTTLEGLVGNAESGMAKDVADNTSAIETLNGDETVEGSVAKTVKDAVAASEESINETIGEVAEGKTVVEMIADAQTAATYDDTEVKASIKANADAIELLTNGVSAEEVDGVNDLIQYVKDHGSEVTAMQDDIAANTASITEEKERAEGVEAELLGKIEALEGAGYATKEEVATAKTEANTYTDEAVAQMLVDSKAYTDEKVIIAAVDESQFDLGDNKTLTLLDIAIDKVTGLQAALDAKANTADVYTKEETLDKIAEKITEINGGESAGEVLSQLNSYKETNNARVDAIETTLSGIEAGAEVNDIVAITLGGSETALTITERVVDIPVATTEALGVVKLSAEVGVDENNALEVKSLNVNKLVQSDGDTLILNGGSAQ